MGVEIIQLEEQKEKRMKKSEDKELMGYHQINWFIHCKSHKRRKERGAQSLFKEIITENFPNLG